MTLLQKINKKYIGIGVITVGAFALTQSFLIAYLLGVTVSRVSAIVAAAYAAYEAGESIADAVSVATGPGVAVSILVSIIGTYGFMYVMHSLTLKSW